MGSSRLLKLQEFEKMPQREQTVTTCDDCGKEHIVVTKPAYFGGKEPPYVELVEYAPMLVDRKYFCNRKCLQNWLEDQQRGRK